MSEWKECKLSCFMEFNPLTSMKKGTTGIKIRMEDLMPNEKKIRTWEISSFNGGAKFKNGDTLVARITPCLENGKIGYVDILKDDEVAFGSTEFIVLRKKENISDSQFVFYLAYWNEFRDLAIQLMTGSSGRQRVETDALKNKIFLLPPLPEQKAIAEALSSLDDKIDLLHRQNKTLEAMAETLFRQWFVEDADISTVKLGDIIEIFDSKRIPLSSTERDKRKLGALYPYYGAATIMDYINDYIFDGEYLLLGEDGTVQTGDGYPILQLATGKFWVNNHAHVIIAKKPYSTFLLYSILKKTSISHIVTGAVQPKINQENLKSLEIEVPEEEAIKATVKQTNTIWDKMQCNNEQIKTLEKLRDTFLPKLMSGEVRIKV